MLRLSKNIEIIFNKNQLQEIKRIINDFKTMKLQNFYEKYGEKLYLQNCEWVNQFSDMEDCTYVYEPFSESYKKDYLDLLICWIMYMWNLGFMVSGSELQESYTIIEMINNILDNKLLDDFEIEDKFGQEILLKSIIQDSNFQLRKKKMKLIQIYIEDLTYTYYFFLFENELADKLINSYNNELLSFNEVTCEDYICSFYFDIQLKQNNSCFKYKKKIKQNISSQIEYLLKQGVKNFLMNFPKNMEKLI